MIDPETGKDVPTGQPGEVWVRGPQVMKGYLNNPEATARTVDADGWLHTGDIGVMDDDGYLTVVDRLKELIKVKGFQVAPAELESLLLKHPKIADVAVIPVADEQCGEVPKAIVVDARAAHRGRGDARSSMPKVAHYKRVRHVAFVDAIPKSPSGKILRRILVDRERTGRARRYAPLNRPSNSAWNRSIRSVTPPPAATASRATPAPRTPASATVNINRQRR